MTFDPTPRSDTAGLRPQSGDLTPFGPNRGDGLPADDPQGFAGFDPLDVQPSELDGQQGAQEALAPTPTGSGGLAPGWWVAMVVLLVAALALGWWWWHGRHAPVDEDPTRAGLLAVSHVLVGAAALGVGRHRSETLAEVAARWHAEHDVPADDAATLATLGGKAAFGGALDPEESRRLRDTCERVGTHLHEQATLPDRILATPRRFRANA